MGPLISVYAIRKVATVYIHPIYTCYRGLRLPTGLEMWQLGSSATIPLPPTVQTSGEPCGLDLAHSLGLSTFDLEGWGRAWEPTNAKLVSHLVKPQISSLICVL